MNKKLVSINMLGIILMLAMSLVSSSSAQVSVAQDEEVTLIYALPYDFTEYSVYTGSSYANAQWQSAVINALYKRSTVAERDWIPDLAAGVPEVSENLTDFTIDIREDLVFSNGDPLTADDVVFSFKVAMTPLINIAFGGIYSGFMDNSSVVKNSDLQVTVKLQQTFAFPFSFLATPIIPEETYGAKYQSCIDGVAADCSFNNPDLSDVIGAGPYVASDYDDTNQVVTLTKNENYADWDTAAGNVDKIIYKKTTEKTAAIAELAAGDIDILDAQYIPGVDELSFLPGVSEVFVGAPSHQEISLNHLHGHYGTGADVPDNGAATEAERLADALLVRRAMSHIVDREFAANEISDGLAQPASTTMPSASLGWDATITPRAFDIDMAKSLMEQAGYDYADLTDTDSDGSYDTFFFEIDVMSPNTNPARNEWSAAFVLELPKIGIGVIEHHSVGWDVIIPRTFGYAVGTSLVPLWDDGGYDVLFVGYGWALDWNPQGLYDSAGSHLDGSGGNFMNFDLVQSDESLTSDVEELVLQYLSTLDFSDRIEVVENLQQELHDNIPVIPILYPQSHWGFQTGLSNVDALLLGTSSQEWDQVVKSDVEPTSTVDTSESDEPTDEPEDSNTDDEPISFITVIATLFGTAFLAVFVNRKRK